MLRYGVLGSALLVDVTLGLEAFLARRVFDDTLTAAGVDKAVGALHGAIRKPGLLTEAAALVLALARVVAELVVSLQLSADADVV